MICIDGWFRSGSASCTIDANTSMNSGSHPSVGTRTNSRTPACLGRKGGRGARRYKYSVEGAGAGGLGWGKRGSSSVMVRALTPATFSSTLPYPSPHSTPRRGFSCCGASSHEPVPRGQRQGQGTEAGAKVEAAAAAAVEAEAGAGAAAPAPAA
eukprot:scaffold11629_cov131-Isochrysis_galbana.AAC.5